MGGSKNILDFNKLRGFDLPKALFDSYDLRAPLPQNAETIGNKTSYKIDRDYLVPTGPQHKVVTQPRVTQLAAPQSSPAVH